MPCQIGFKQVRIADGKGTVSTAEILQSLLYKMLVTFYTMATPLSAQKMKNKTQPSIRTQNSLTRKARVKSASGLTLRLLM